VGAGAGLETLAPDGLGLEAGSGADLEIRERIFTSPPEGLGELLGGVFLPPLLGPPEEGLLTLLKLRPERLGLFLSLIDFLLNGVENAPVNLDIRSSCGANTPS
jgi:hypothetical protein